MLPMVARSELTGSDAAPWPVKLHKLSPTTFALRSICVMCSTRSVAVTPSLSAPVEMHADDFRSVRK